MPIPVSHATRRMLREIDAYKKSPEYLRSVFEEIHRKERERLDRLDSLILPRVTLNDFKVDLASAEMRIFQCHANLTLQSIYITRPPRPKYFGFDDR